MSSLSSDIKQKVEQKVELCVSLCNEHYDRNFKLPTIEFNKRGSSAGTAYYNSYKIKFNPTLLINNQDLFIAKTVPHEVAHLMSYKLYDKDGTGHGRRWKELMRVMQVPNHMITRCHSYDTSHTKPHVYECDCREFNLTTRMHNDVNRGNLRSCKSCKGILKYKHSIQDDTIENVIPKKKEVKMPSPGTKAYDAYWLMTDLLNRRWHIKNHKDQIIHEIMCDLDMTYKGATTYYYNTKKIIENIG